MSIIKLLPFSAVIFGVVCNPVIEHQNEGRKDYIYLLYPLDTGASPEPFQSWQLPQSKIFWKWDTVNFHEIQTRLGVSGFSSDSNLLVEPEQVNSSPWLKSSSKSLDHWVMCCTSFVDLAKYAFSLCTLAPFPRRLTWISNVYRSLGFLTPIWAWPMGSPGRRLKKVKRVRLGVYFLSSLSVLLLSWPCPSVEFKWVAELFPSW